jgi:hypothetical protein
VLGRLGLARDDVLIEEQDREGGGGKADDDHAIDP